MYTTRELVFDNAFHSCFLANLTYEVFLCFILFILFYKYPVVCFLTIRLTFLTFLLYFQTKTSVDSRAYIIYYHLFPLQFVVSMVTLLNYWGTPQHASCTNLLLLWNLAMV